MISDVADTEGGQLRSVAHDIDAETGQREIAQAGRGLCSLKVQLVSDVRGLLRIKGAHPADGVVFLPEGGDFLIHYNIIEVRMHKYAIDISA
ncbi:MAG: hypothetical protein AAGC95_08810 [Pseudomonadota bacterium]